MRKPMVTRTITTTTATILCANTATRAMEEKALTLPRTYADEKAVMKYIDKHQDSFDLGDLKPVSMISKVENNQLYKMSEEDFIKYATPTTDADENDEESDGE